MSLLAIISILGGGTATEEPGGIIYSLVYLGDQLVYISDPLIYSTET